MKKLNQKKNLKSFYKNFKIDNQNFGEKMLKLSLCENWKYIYHLQHKDEIPIK